MLNVPNIDDVCYDSFLLGANFIIVTIFCTILLLTNLAVIYRIIHSSLNDKRSCPKEIIGLTTGHLLYTVATFLVYVGFKKWKTLTSYFEIKAGCEVTE